MNAGLHVFCLALDARPHDERIIDIHIGPHWNLSDLRDALKRDYPFYRRVYHEQIEVWVLKEYLDDDTILPLDPKTATTYNDVPIIKIEAGRIILSYFPNRFERDSEDAMKIHMVVKSCQSKYGLSDAGLQINAPRVEATAYVHEMAVPKMAAFITPRDELCLELETMLTYSQFVQVRGTPACGKSVFLHLFQGYMQLKHPHALIYRIARWPPNQTGLRPLKDLTRNPSFPYNISSPTYLLIDEGQVTYGDAALWTEFKSMFIAENIWVVLFCSYGSSSPALDRAVTPHRFAPEEMLGLWGGDSAGHGLLFSRDEFNDVITRSRVLLTQNVASAIFDFSAGHAGAVAFLLRSIRRKNLNAHSQGISYTLDQFREQHPAHRLARDFPESSPGRGLPLYGDLRNRPEIAKMFRKLLGVGYILQDETNQAIQDAHQEGWIYWARDEYGRDAFFIASPLHAACLSWSLMPSVQSLPHVSILELTIDVISRFKRSQIFRPYQAVGPISDNVCLTEAQYQAEFYRSLHQLASGEVQITLEFASGKGTEIPGCLDFVIPSMKWGFEITREGAKLQQDSDRFSQDGAYGEMITKGLITEYILVDCRTTPPRKAHPDIPNLLHAVFNFERFSVEIVDNQQQKLKVITLT